MSPSTCTLGSFRSGNADVRLCVSCANPAVRHSYEPEPLRTLRSTTVIGKNKVVLEVRRSWGLANQRPSRLARLSVHALHEHIQYTAELRGSFAKALVRRNGPKNALKSRLVAFSVAQLAASPCESSLVFKDGAEQKNAARICELLSDYLPLY